MPNSPSIELSPIAHLHLVGGIDDLDEGEINRKVQDPDLDKEKCAKISCLHFADCYHKATQAAETISALQVCIRIPISHIPFSTNSWMRTVKQEFHCPYSVYSAGG